MIKIKLQDGSEKQSEDGISCFDVATSIDKMLACDAVAAEINGKLCDITTILQNGDEVKIITADSDLGASVIRHDAAHILARAMKELYGSKLKIAVGPSTRDGFFYDFEYDGTFSTHDFGQIEDRVQEIIKRNEKFERRVIDRREAIEYFEKFGEVYKVQLIKAIPEDEQIIVYVHGDFIDLCKGPHAPTPSLIKAFKILKVAGAYWRGNRDDKMLQRIYGVAYNSEQKLVDYLHFLEEVEKRDHRKVGREMQLFHMQEEASGIVFWHHRGCTLFRTMVSFLRKCQENAGYVEIITPEIMDKCIWEQSGHWDKFADQIYTASARDAERTYAVRPMNCPGAVQVFKHGVVSYKQLPMHVAEFGKVYRFEPSGALHGLFRVRGFTQDDAHVYCTEEQTVDECIKVCKLLCAVYSAFGFEDIIVKLATRPVKRLGDDAIWDRSENALKDALESVGMKYLINPGEGAFYGPKLEFTLRDVLGRDWQIGTLQVDFNLPDRFEMLYVASDGTRRRPVMLHRAIVGSIERFTGILLEHYSGHLPIWLAPVQVVMISITESAMEYINGVYKAARSMGIRAAIDIENETLNYKIRKYSLEKIPVIIMAGNREVEGGMVSVRKLGDLGYEVMSIEGALEFIRAQATEPVISV